MKKLKLITILSITFFAFSCKKNTSENTDTTNSEVITGTVIAPPSMSTNGWVVNSGFSESIVKNNTYSIDVAKDAFSLQFVSDATGKDILLGLKYPGQTDFTINSASTVVALLLQMPPVSSLTKDGKLNFINSIRSNSLFSTTVQALEAQLSDGDDLFDTTNNVLNGLLEQLFENSSLRINEDFSENVTILRNGKNLIFQNPGKPFVQVIGIYKDNQRIEKIQLDRYTYFVSGLSAIPGAIGNPPSPIEASYSLGGDGDYEVRVRSGKSINSIEGKEALKANLSNLAIDNLSSLISFIPFVNLNNNCVRDIRSTAISNTSNIVDAVNQDITSSAKITRLVYEISKSTIDIIKTSVGCATNPPAIGFFNKLTKLLNFIDKVSTVSTVLNNSIFAYQFLSTPAEADTCFKVQGNTVTNCGCDGPSTVTDIDGNVYNVVKIGNQCWMKENLKTTRYNDGTAIPTGLSDVAWQTTTSGAYTINNNNAANNTTYGKLYNWYAVNTGKLAPAGWHVPTDAEWTTLINYLGGESVAGGAMKDSTLWSSPNTGATNSSGFTGLPAGDRSDEGSFYNIGDYGYFWSSTESNTVSAWNRNLGYINSATYRGSYNKRNGFSVRCVRD